MSDSRSIFQTLQSPTQGMNAEQWLLHYCSEVWKGVERVHFDFKEKSDRSNGSPTEADKKNLAKAVSGFANSGGGVLIWGINDDAKAKPITEYGKFLDKCLELCVHLTDPVVAGIDGACIESASGDNQGYVIIHIPESRIHPHRVILKQENLNGHYYVRSGSSFVVASHVQLADMFGRRPKPLLDLHFDLTARRVNANFEVIVDAILVNEGRGLAKYPYVSLSVNPPYYVSAYGLDGNGKSGLATLSATDQVTSGYLRGYLHIEFGSKSGDVIHSGARRPLTKILGEFASDSLLSDLEIRVQFAAEGTPVETKHFMISQRELMAAYGKKLLVKEP